MSAEQEGDQQQPQQQGQPQQQSSAPPTAAQQTQQPSPPSAGQNEASASTTTTQQQQQQQQPQQQQQQPPPPSSSSDPPEPPQEPPKPITPGPRAARLQQLFATTLRHTLDKVSRDNFAACFPTIARRAPGTLEFVQRQMVERLGAQCNKEFDAILTNRQVVPKLNELEGLVSEAVGRRKATTDGGDPPVPPHTLPASTVLEAHLAPHLAAQQSQLNAKLQTTQAHNARLFEEIRAQRAEIESLLAAVEKVLADVDGANELLDDVVDDLARETRAVEVEMMGNGGN